MNEPRVQPPPSPSSVDDISALWPARSRSWWIWLLLIVAGAGTLPLTFAAGRAVLHRLARSRSDHYAGVTAKLIASGQFEAAMPHARAAVILAPWNPAGHLQMARGLSAFSNPHALDHWLDYFALTTSVGTLSSLEFARYNLQLGRPQAARQQLQTIRQTNQLAVLLALATLETNAAAAEHQIAAAQRLASSPAERLAVATTACATPSAAAQLAGRSAIMELAGAGESGAQAILLTQPGTNSAFAVASFDRIATNRWLPVWQPVADLVAGRTRSADPLLATLSRQPDNLCLGAVLANLGTNVSTPELAVASREHPGLFFIQVDQLRAQKRWEELETIVGDMHRRLPRDLRHGLAAIAAHGRGDTTTAYTRMSIALAEAQWTPARVLGLARLAGGGEGFPEFEAQAWMRLGREPELGDVGGHRLFELGMRHAHLDWVAAGAQQLAHGDPASAWFGTWVYARCLLQMSASGVPEPMGKQRDCVLAAILRNVLLHRTEEALAGIAQTASWPDEPDRLKLVKGLAYDRAGLHSAMRRQLTTITTFSGLLPEEITLLRSLTPEALK